MAGRRLALAALLIGPAAAAFSGPPAARAQASLLATPGDYSLAPPAPAAPALLPGGVASTSFGSNGMRSSAVELDSGLIGGSTRAFLALGAGQGPRWHGSPAVSGSSIAAGIATSLPFGTTLTVSGGIERDRFSGRGQPLAGIGALP